MDEETVLADETAGSILFDLQELIKHNQSASREAQENEDDHGDEHQKISEKESFIWKNVYGSPLNQGQTEAKK